jgi:RNA polymerase sigma-70 factor (ECF subfamily)
LVDLYADRVFGLLQKHCRDRDLAEELTQATFVRVVRKLGDYRERGRFEPWLFRIAMNLLRDEMRRRKRQAIPTDMTGAGRSADGEAATGWQSVQVKLASGAMPEQTTPFEQLVQAEQVEQLKLAVEQLPEADREVLYLRHTAGLSFSDIAQTLEQPLGTVLARGHRALGKLRKMLEIEGGLEN